MSDFDDQGFGSKQCSYCHKPVYRAKTCRRHTWDARTMHVSCLRHKNRAEEDAMYPPEFDCGHCGKTVHRGVRPVSEWRGLKYCCKKCARAEQVPASRRSEKDAPPRPPGWNAQWGGIVLGEAS